jgi:homogentisate 1,2-dioxygenase
VPLAATQANIKNFSTYFVVTPSMYRRKVKSSALDSVGYDGEKQVLELEFKEHSGVWQYYDFQPAVFDRFISSDSLGNFFVTKIKGNYREKQVG